MRPEHLADTRRATGAAMAVSRAAIEAAGLLDEELFLYAEDLEWSLRIAEAGFAVVYVPEAKVRHRVSAAAGGAGSPTTSYYETRNMLAVVERYRPLPRGLTGLRRGLVVAPRVAARGATAGLGPGGTAGLAGLPPRPDGPSLASPPWRTSAAASTAESSSSCSTRG